MAVYTTELGTALRDQFPNSPTKEVIELGRQWLFDFEYPYAIPEAKAEFETRFIRHFFDREIGFETEDLFKFKLETWMLINMPYFNKLLASELLKFDPFLSYDLTSEHTRLVRKNEFVNTSKNQTVAETGTTTRNEDTEDKTDNTRLVESVGSTEGTSNDNGTSFNRQLTNETPDNRLAIEYEKDSTTSAISYASRIQEDKGQTVNQNDTESTSHDTTNYTDNVTREASVSGTENVSKGTTNNENDNLNRNEDDTEDFKERRFGSIGVKTLSEMLNEYRGTFIRIEVDMFKEMDKLFMQIF